MSTALHATSSKILPGQDKANPENFTASHGTVFLAAIKAPLANTASTGAPFADQNPTPLNNVTLSPNILSIITPFRPDQWDLMLTNTNSPNKFRDVPTSMCFGFDMGVHTPPAHTYSPPNHTSALSFPTHVLSHIQSELSHQRYSGPFSRSRLEFLIGPFRTSPLGTVPKSGSPDERRIIQDLSFPRNIPTFSSVNDQIDVDNFRCDWGTFNEVRNIVMDAPSYTEAATLDVDSAFRRCPIIPSQQCNFIVHWDNLFT